MSRYGRFVDARWITQRMDAKDARVSRATSRAAAWALVRRLAGVYTVESDQAALIRLVADAQALLRREEGAQ